MCKIGDEKIWSQGMLERFNVVLAHLRRVQDGTRWIQCIRSMGDPEIKKLKEMVAMIPEDDFQRRPKKPKAPPGEDVDGQELPEDLDHDGQTDSCLSSGPTKYKPPSDSGDSGTESTTGSYHQGQDQEEMEHYEEASCLQNLWQINSEKHQGENQTSW